MQSHRSIASLIHRVKRFTRSRFVRFLVVSIGLVLVVEGILNLFSFFYYQPIKQELNRVAQVSQRDFVILCVGDSHVYGINCDRSLTWPKQLEKRLEAAYPDVNFEAINTGVPGYNSSEALDTMKEYIRKYPGLIDAVIFEAGRNNPLSFRKASILPRDFSELTWYDQAKFLLTNSKTYRLNQLTELNLRAALKLDWKPLFQVNLSKDFLLQWLTNDYTEALETARENRILFAFMNYVIPGDLFSGYVTSAMKKMSQEQGVAFLDIENYRLPAAAFFTLPVLSTRDGHPNERGNRVIADILYQELARHPRLQQPFSEKIRAARGINEQDPPL